MSDQKSRKTAVDDNKLRLTAPKIDGADKPPTLQVRMDRNNVHILVWTNKPSDKFGGNLSARMDSIVFNMFMQKLTDVINGEPGCKEYVENKFKPREKKELEIMSQLVFGKDKEGRVYISVISPDESRPKIKFVFKNSYFHRFVHGSTGEPYTEAEVSVLTAKAWQKLLGDMVNIILATDFQPPEPRAGGRGNYDNKQQPRKTKADDDFGGGGSSDWEDDFPM